MKFTNRQSERKEGGGNFLKLKDGDAVRGVFVGEIFEFFQIWPFGGEKQVFSQKVPGSTSRFKANFAVYEQGNFVAKIFEFGLPVYIQLADINAVYPLEKTKIQITRRGTAKNTTYAILPLLTEPVPPKALSEIAALKLNILGNNEPSPDSAGSIAADEVPWPDGEQGLSF